MAKVHFRSYIHNQMVLFPERIDKDIAENAPVRIVNGIIDSLCIDNLLSLYHPSGRNPYHPKMMLKVIIYAYEQHLFLPQDRTTSQP